MKRFSKTEMAAVADLNITPLLDLAWVMLVIFILTATALIQRIDIALPQTQENKKEVSSQTTTVSLDRNGNAYLNDAPVTLEQLAEQLKLLKAADPDLPVVFRADEVLEYKKVVEVLDVLQAVPIEELALATQVDRS
jgi:biopolymer transport protein ExbD